MAATVRVAQVVATGSAVASKGPGKSLIVGNQPVVRIADITASAGLGAPVVRVADITATTGIGGSPLVRIAQIEAIGVQHQYAWNGTQWVDAAPSGVILSRGHGVSSTSGSVTITANVASTGRGRSSISGKVSFSGTLSITAQPADAFSGVANQQPGDTSGTLSVTATGTVSFSGSATQGPPGAGSVTVVLDPTNSPPRVLLELTGFLGSTVTIVRIDASGSRTPVRLANPGTLNGGGIVLYDYEAPYGVTVTYEATATRVVTSDPVVLNVDEPWLVHPGIPAISCPLYVSALGDDTQDINQSVQYAIGRRNPIVETDAIRHAPTFDLTVGTSTVVEQQALDGLLGDGSALLLQIPDTDIPTYRWVAIGAVTKSRPVAFYKDPHRLWTLPCTVTDAPSGLLQAQRTWADVVSAFSSWQDVVDSYDTWQDEIIDNQLA